MKIVCNDKPLNIPEEHLFLGECKGVALIPRSENDDHIYFLILTEEDGNWYCGNSRTSSYWIGELAHQILKAEKWLKESAVEDTFGYRFK
jgi:hypothetical protein